MADYKLITFVIIMFSINVILAMAQTAILEVNSEGPNFYNSSSSPISTYVSGSGDNSTFTPDTDSLGLETVDQTSTETGNLFTDTFKTVSNFFDGLNDSFGFVKSILSQPYQFMKDIGIPSIICTSFAVIWYSIIVLLMVGFFRGSNQ